MSDMVEVVIDSIRVSLMNQQRIVILREIDAERYLAIWVGVYEAEHLTVALQGVEVSRPLTYDLFKNVLRSLNAQILRVEVVALRDETFFGNIVMEVNGEVMHIDSRPSDALNLAARMNVPILVAREVMDSAGIVPQEDEVTEAPDEELEGAAAGPEASSERLSVFEDFLSQLDLEDMDDDEDDD
ncbi:MAG: bifunctional nuclease family protein [Anaerolineales bacterium]|nr:bifunctional nuclease family protein [Anaerolineales bacterium]